MPFVQHDYMIEAVASYGADESLHERVLPRTARGTENLLDAHAVNSLLEYAAIDRVAISKKVVLPEYS